MGLGKGSGCSKDDNKSDNESSKKPSAKPGAVVKVKQAERSSIEERKIEKEVEVSTNSSGGVENIENMDSKPVAGRGVAFAEKTVVIIERKPDINTGDMNVGSSQELSSGEKHNEVMSTQASTSIVTPGSDTDSSGHPNPIESIITTGNSETVRVSLSSASDNVSSSLSAGDIENVVISNQTYDSLELSRIRMSRSLAPTASVVTAAIQKPAPDFRGTAVVNGEFKEISLDDYKGKYLIFFFYPADFTFVCPTEIIAFSDRAEEFRKLNCEIVAVSTDSQYTHFAWISTPRKQGGLGPMDIPLLADKTGDISKRYGVYKDDEGIAFRGLFIIDGKQNLRQMTINDLPVGRDVDETLRLVQAFQFTDEFGEVCPAGWKPGQKTIKPNVAESKEYFETS